MGAERKRDVYKRQELGIVLSPKNFPKMLMYQGKDLITTDGTTLLGADNKAGITAIVGMVEYLLEHPEVRHGTIKIGFTPDEEVGTGVDHFNVEKFGAQFALSLIHISVKRCRSARTEVLRWTGRCWTNLMWCIRRWGKKWNLKFRRGSICF